MALVRENSNDETTPASDPLKGHDMNAAAAARNHRRETRRFAVMYAAAANNALTSLLAQPLPVSPAPALITRAALATAA